MVRVMEGDRKAFGVLYDRHAPRIRAFVARYVGQGDVADDLTQEVFLKVYRKPASFDPRSRFTTWLYAVARNASIDFLRLKRLPTVPAGVPGRDGRDFAVEPVAVGASPEEALLHRELKDHMHEILSGMSKKLKEVFVLCAIEGLSYEEAAEVLDCPVKTVSSRLSRARNYFFEAFERFLQDSSLRDQGVRP